MKNKNNRPIGNPGKTADEGGQAPEKAEKSLARRDFLKKCACALPGFCLLALTGDLFAGGSRDSHAEKLENMYGMGVDILKCIGCGRCVNACKLENKVPPEPFYFRTWVERYIIKTNEEVIVESPLGGSEGFSSDFKEKGILRTFFVPKLCNHCSKPPCVQVCPVGATFSTKEGVVLVDKDYCIGCRYCIQACPYGARFLDPHTRTAEKCTFCYHRITKGMLPACVEVCPTKARIFGKISDRKSPLSRFMRFNIIQVLKPALNTEPRVYYADLDGEVR